MRLDNKAVLHFLLVCALIYDCSAKGIKDSGNHHNTTEMTSQRFIARMIEEGRTMVHHTVKRFMIILPAVFFKLGVAFTLLVLVAIAAVNNGFIGFMLLVVGLSSVLARMQESTRKHAAVPIYLPYLPTTGPAHHHIAYHHGWDRNDDKVKQITTTPSYLGYFNQNQQYVYTPLEAYTAAYHG